jgi:hypothetical protein
LFPLKVNARSAFRVLKALSGRYEVLYGTATLG